MLTLSCLTLLALALLTLSCLTLLALALLTLSCLTLLALLALLALALALLALALLTLPCLTLLALLPLFALFAARLGLCKLLGLIGREVKFLGELVNLVGDFAEFVLIKSALLGCVLCDLVKLLGDSPRLFTEPVEFAGEFILAQSGALIRGLVRYGVFARLVLSQLLLKGLERVRRVHDVRDLVRVEHHNHLVGAAVLDLDGDEIVRCPGRVRQDGLVVGRDGVIPDPVARPRADALHRKCKPPDRVLLFRAKRNLNHLALVTALVHQHNGLEAEIVVGEEHERQYVVGRELDVPSGLCEPNGRCLVRVGHYRIHDGLRIREAVGIAIPQVVRTARLHGEGHGEALPVRGLLDRASDRLGPRLVHLLVRLRRDRHRGAGVRFDVTPVLRPRRQPHVLGEIVSDAHVGD